MHTTWLVDFTLAYVHANRLRCTWTVIEKSDGVSIDDCMYHNGLVRAMFDGGVKSVRMLPRKNRQTKASKLTARSQS